MCMHRFYKSKYMRVRSSHILKDIGTQIFAELTKIYLPY